MFVPVFKLSKIKMIIGHTHCMDKIFCPNCHKCLKDRDEGDNQKAQGTYRVLELGKVQCDLCRFVSTSDQWIAEESRRMDAIAYWQRACDCMGFLWTRNLGGIVLLFRARAAK